MYYKIQTTEKLKTKAEAESLMIFLLQDGWRKDMFEIVEVS